MAFFSNWLLSLKLLLLSTGVLSFAMALKLTLPLLSHFIVSDVPSFWSLFLTWLRPPYLYILLNGIIITIVASSKIHNNKKLDDGPDDPLVVLRPDDPTLLPDSLKVSGEIRSADYAVYNGFGAAVNTPPPEPIKISGDLRRTTDYAVYNGVVWETVTEAQDAKISNVEKGEIGKEDLNYSPSYVATSLQRKEPLGLSFCKDDEKSPVSARFGHRKSAKTIPQGGKAALGVAKPKRHDTLESTWKTITEGRAMPLTRHLKKSDTWDSHHRRNVTPLTEQNENTPPNPKVMKKSETFSERSKNSSASPSPGSGRMRKEPSLSQDELNRRVEAFIRKFNEEMRLQRQESLRQYNEMVNRR
ncbi:uncharacterized protein G2W53_011631 [Senna tora]|uniref:DUF4408 domain-containing protein n=1 Tax=Senna tora TaxID=362788 RepID=A0A834X373_9FABA|nr:uncharacterized protein G2W53_011631 [Senna tora]